MDFILPIFPQGALAGSVFTTVWIGVWVIVFFNLRLGWVLSGLVVPGYLVPLLLIKPWSAAVIVFEALVTYLLVWIFSEKLSNLGRWNNFFGRDRFFALLLVSVIVRMVFETFLFPPLGIYLNETLNIQFDYQNLLHSYGLIIVALIANQFWKPGLLRGLVPLSVTVFVTFLLVRFVLMPFTNFSLGNIGYMYEDLAASMLASPKAYIILLATALTASRMNLRYGWEYSGILIPALLALQWYNPTKLLASLAEAFVILIIARLILRLPIFKNATVEGGRKILLFFNISFIYKLILGYIILWAFPQYKITDYYAFGYLLATLLAMKMYDKNMLGQVTRATLQTSLVSVFLASVIGFSLQLLPNVFALDLQKKSIQTPQKQSVNRMPNTSIAELIQKHKLDLYQTRLKNLSVRPSPREIELFAYSIRQLKTFGQSRAQNVLQKAGALLSRIDYQVDLVNNDYLFIHEKTPQKGWGSFVINTTSQNDLLVEIPAPLEAWGTLDAGTRLFITFNARALSIAGPTTQSLLARTQEPAFSQDTLFYTFHQTMNQFDTLQIRGYTSKTIRQLTGQRTQPGAPLPAISSRLYIKSALPAGLDLSRLKSFIDTFDILWGQPQFANILRDKTRSGFAELLLNRQDRRDLFFKPLFTGVRTEIQSQQRIAGYIQDWLLQGKKWLAASGSNAYQPASLEELLYLDEEVISPLIQLSMNEYTQEIGWTKEGLEELQAAKSAASVLDYEIIRYHHLSSDRDYLILVERQDLKKRRFWGTYIVLLGKSNDFIIQIPRPLYEMRTFEFGIHLFDRLQAQILMIGGTHPLANTDQSSDLILSANKENMFNLFEQVALRQMGPRPMFVAQCRGFGLRPETEFPNADVVIAFKSGLHSKKNIDQLGQFLLNTLQNEGLELRLIDGTPEVMGYEVGGLPQAEYLEQTINKQFALLWLSPLARQSYRQQTENTIQKKQFQALNIGTTQMDVADFISTHPDHSDTAIPQKIIKTIQEYINNQDILDLAQIGQIRPTDHFSRYIDVNTKQAYLVLYDKRSQPLLLANLSPRNESMYSVAHTKITRAFARKFVNNRDAWLLWGHSR